MEWRSLRRVGRDLRVGCVVVCEREGGEERKKREKERISLYSL